MNDPTSGEMPAAIKPWDSDHTALVHVLWAAQHDGLIPKGTHRGDAIADVLASRIMQSQWHQAVKQHATAQVNVERNRYREALKQIEGMPGVSRSGLWRDIAREALGGEA